MTDDSPKYTVVRKVKFKHGGRKYKAKLLRSETGARGLDIQRANGDEMNTEDDDVTAITKIAYARFGIKREDD